jgi:chromate reductase, NAD(P)H dehydrogenase (quinone)
MKIIAYGGSNSRHSINRKFATWTAGLFENAEVEVLDMLDYTMPLFSVDLEKEIPTPAPVAAFLEKIVSADLIVLSLAENNSSYNAGFKNIFDWVSRTNPKQFQGKPMLLMATSPGKRGGASVLEGAMRHFPFYGADIKASFSLPAFHQNFDEEKGITDAELRAKLLDIVTQLNNSL